MRQNVLKTARYIGLKFLPRIQVIKEGKKRRLVINGVKLEDAGKITCKSNADEAEANLGVKCEYIPLP